MTARRQASTTSLSKFERSSSPALRDGSLDFCNAFWGVGDGGVEVLFARMRGAARTVEELRNFWKERATIEEDYAKRLAKLSKAVLGRDEIGDLRVALNTVKAETERQASYHAGLASQLRSEMEAQTTAFHHRQLSQKKTQQTNIEKEFKTKQAQEAHVNKAREKYEQDGMRINAYTAQSSLVQGKELDKIQSKLERANQTVQVNERDFANFAKILAETTQKWELSWKAFCDNCQDLEESRIEFMKDIVWNYANSVSTVCVQDDESCEKVRLSLETMEPEREMENFVLTYGTGNEIPDPPAFVNYNSPDAVPAGSARVTTRPANFVRASARELPRASSIEPPDPGPQVNSAGVGAGGNRRSEIPVATDPTDLMRLDTRRNSVPASHPAVTPLVNGASHHQQDIVPISSFPPLNPQRSAAPNTSSAPRRDVGNSGPTDSTAETYIKVGERAYKVDPSKDPQQQPPSAISAASPVKLNGTVDPLEKQLQALQSVVSTTGSARRNTLHKPVNDGHPPSTSPSVSAPSRPSSNAPPTLSPPGNLVSQTNRSPSPNRDYRNSAEMVVGTHPSTSRPPSPNPPTAAFMVPKPGVSPGLEVISDVLGNYQQSLPGERKSISRNNSRRSSAVHPPGHAPSSSQASINVPNSHHGQSLVRPTSVGHAGVGAHGSRSNSPQPPSRGPSPAPNVARQSFIAPPAQGVARAPSPNSIGIALDPSGRVLHDDMAQGYNQHQQTLRQVQPQQRPPVQHSNFNAPPQQPQQQPSSRRLSYMATPSPTIAPPPQSQMQPRTPPPAVAPLYQQHPPPGPQPNYAPPSTPHAQYTPPSQLMYQQQQQQQSAPQPVQQPPPQQYQPPPQQVPGPPYSGGNQRAPSNPGSGYYQPPQQQTQPIQQQPPPHPQWNAPPPQSYQQQWNAAPAPIAARRSPSPQPPPAQQGGPTTEDGAPIQFYVKALYDYVATIDEEFDFQAGDIIAVTSTPEDGWWTGELLDEARRQRGRNVFPSNFVCLF